MAVEVAAGLVCSLLTPVLCLPRPDADLVAVPPPFAFSPSVDMLAAVAAAVFVCRWLYVTDVSMLLRALVRPDDLGSSAETDEARDVEPDFFPPKYTYYKFTFITFYNGNKPETGNSLECAQKLTTFPGSYYTWQ